MRMGSDYYTAPEVTKDLKRASAQSDIYSLGCILHDMAGTEDRVPCGEIREQGEFSAIFLGCTRKDPSQRFKSARAVLDAILSVDFTAQVAPSAETVDFLNKIQGPADLSEEFWESLADFIEHTATIPDSSSIFSNLTTEKIEALCTCNTYAARRIGCAFAQWVSNSAFNFDYCDALANRLEDFFNRTEFEVKVECLLALLYMGISHNRWFVEWKFMRFCGSEMDINLAKRVAIQFRIIGKDICRKVEALERSITVSRIDLHATLAGVLADICGSP